MAQTPVCMVPKKENKENGIRVKQGDLIKLSTLTEPHLDWGLPAGGLGVVGAAHWGTASVTSPLTLSSSPPLTWAPWSRCWTECFVSEQRPAGCSKGDSTVQCKDSAQIKISFSVFCTDYKGKEVKVLCQGFLYHFFMCVKYIMVSALGKETSRHNFIEIKGWEWDIYIACWYVT